MRPPAGSPRRQSWDALNADGARSAVGLNICGKLVERWLHSVVVLQLFVSVHRLRISPWAWILLIWFLFVVPAIALRGYHFEDVLAPTSLRRSVAAALGLESTAAEVYWIWCALQALWLAAVVAYFAAVPRGSAEPAQQKRFRLADACVLLLAPLPLNTWFVPYHAIIMLPTFVLLLTVALDASWPISVRAPAYRIREPIVRQFHNLETPWQYREIPLLSSRSIG